MYDNSNKRLNLTTETNTNKGNKKPPERRQPNRGGKSHKQNDKKPGTREL